MKTNTIPTGVQQTTDYDQFSYIHGNRKLAQRHLAQLTVSVLTRNMLAQNPIIVNEKMEIIDGQHRLEVAKNNQLPIYYIILEQGSIEDVMVTNSSSRAWEARDFLNSYVIRGFKEYIWLKEFMSDYDINLRQALVFLFGGERTYVLHMIRTGQLKASDEEKTRARQRAGLWYEIRQYNQRRGIVPSQFLYALNRLSDEGKERAFIKAVIRKGGIHPEGRKELIDAQIAEIMA